MLALAEKLGKWFEKSNLGLLLFRIFFSGFLFTYGVQSFRSTLLLKQLGQPAMAFNLPFSPTFWGIIVAFTLIWTGIFILLGFYFRFALLVLAILSYSATREHLSWSVFVQPYSPAVLLLMISSVFLFIGPGSFSVKGKSSGSSKVSSKEK